ncbi:MAG: HEAT repeat domain-containing protein [Blastocatellia bacterium]|nr:HEAT repeat domain-containing protein [Blastocatellia bacterium]
MPLVIFIVLVFIVVLWWLNSNKALSRNEKLYLKRRGYEIEEAPPAGPPVSSDTRLFGLIESLGDLSPYARQRAAEDLSRLCEEGRRDTRMLSSLVTALDDSDASVRGAVAIALGNLGDARAIEPLNQRNEIEESIHVRAALRRAIEKLEKATAGD